MDVAQAFIRYIHVFSGILWIGFLFFFAFIFAPVMASLGPAIMKSAQPPIAKRVNTWMSAAVGLTYLTGLLLLGMVYHAGGLMFEEGSSWGMASGILTLLVFLLFVPYDLYAKSALGANQTVFAIILSAVSFGMLFVMTDVAGFTYRSAMMHVGVMLGTILAANGAMRIVPAQRRLVSSLEGGSPPDPKDLQLVQTRAVHNAYVAVPLVYTMLNQHTVVPGASSPLWFLGVLLISWAFVAHLFKRSRPQS